MHIPTSSPSRPLEPRRRPVLVVVSVLGTVLTAALGAGLGLDPCALYFVYVLIAIPSGSSVGLAVAAGIAALASWVSLGFAASPARGVEAALRVASIAGVASLAAWWLWRENRRLRVAASAASCAADLLRRSRRQFHALLDSTHDPLLLIDDTGRIQAASESAQRVFGWSPAELDGRALTELIPEVDLGPIRALPPRTTGSGWSGESEALHRSGRAFACEIVATRLTANERDAAEAPLFLLYLSDVTHRRAREIERLHARKMESIGQLAIGIAHEINTPTQYVSDNLHFLKRALAVLEAAAPTQSTPPEPGSQEIRPLGAHLRRLREEAPNAIREALEGIDHIASIVQAMRNFSHPGRGEPTSVHLARAIADTLTVTRHEWKAVAEVVTEVDPNLGPILAAPGEINQLLLNLIVNAAHAIADLPTQKCDGSKASSICGRIEIRADAEGGFAALRIRDSGTGMPESIRERIFEPFFTTKEVGRGTGQGLAIVHAIVRRHGGTIECASVVGEGTTFLVRLPLAKPDAE